MSGPQIVRPVGTVGLWNTARHSLGLYRCVINTSRYIPPVTISSTRRLKPMLQAALAAVVKKHGFLRVGIVNEDTNNPAFTHVQRINLEEMVHWTEHTFSAEVKYRDATDMEHLLRSLEVQHDQLWRDLPTRPGWKLVVRQGLLDGQVRSLDISFCFHHAYMDGKSSYIFHRDLLAALIHISTGETPPPLSESAILEFTDPPTLPPAAEDLIPFKISSRFVVTSVWEELVKDLIPSPSFFRRKQNADTIPWTGEMMSPDHHKANLRCICLENNNLTKLLVACHAHNATLTGLLHALVFASLAYHLPGAKALCFRSTCPISLSRYARRPRFDPESMLHCLVTSSPYRFGKEDVSRLRAAQSVIPGAGVGAGVNEIIWETAAKVTASLREKVATLPQDDIVSLMSWIPDWRQFFSAKSGKKRTDTFEVSNLGSMRGKAAGFDNANREHINIEDDTTAGQTISEGMGAGPGAESRWCIDRAIFSQGAMPVGPAFGVNVAGVEGQGLWITVNWQEGAVDAWVVDEVVGDLQRWVDGFAGARGFWHRIQS